MLKKHSWLLILPVIVVNASAAHADPLGDLVKKDLYTSQLSNPKDLEQQELSKEGVEQAPTPLTPNQESQLKPVADILWNRTWYENHPGALDHPGSVETQKEKDNLANVLLPQASKNYNKVIEDIKLEQKQAGQKAELEKRQTLSTPKGADPESSSGCGIASSGSAAAENLKNLVITTNAATQEAVHVEQSADAAKAQAVPLAAIPADIKSEPVSAVPITKIDLANTVHANVDNSQFELSGVTPAQNQGVMLVVHKIGGLTTPTGSEVRGPIQSDSQGHFDLKGYLAEGSGEYEVQVGYKDPTLANSYPTFKTFTITNTDPQSEIYKQPSALINSDDPSTIALAGKIVTAAGAKTDLQKAQAIHDWVATHISYDHTEYDAITADQSIPWKSSSATISSGKGVCYDYAAAYAALGRAAGLQVRMANGLVAGSPQSHEWDEVLIGSNWISVDATWDAGQTASEKYFDPATSVFDQDHQKQENSAL